MDGRTDVWINTFLNISRGEAQLEKQEIKCSLRKCIEELLPHIRFLSMTEKEFMQHVYPTDIFTVTEIIAILRNIIVIKSDPDMPKVAPCTYRQRSRFSPKSLQTIITIPEPSMYGYSYNFYSNGNGFILEQFTVSSDICLRKVDCQLANVTTVHGQGGSVNGQGRGTTLVISDNEGKKLAEVNDDNTSFILRPVLGLTKEVQYDFKVVHPHLSISKPLSYFQATQSNILFRGNTSTGVASIKLSFWCFNS